MQLRLEKERKERQKQKEKERKQRRKEEGKPVTKKERDAEAKRLSHIAALEEQGVHFGYRLPYLHLFYFTSLLGIFVPSKSEGEKKKIKYGSRLRTKKDKSGLAKSGE